MIKMYGINNCDSVKKAKRWLEENEITYKFIDYKSDALPTHKIESWISQFGWKKVINTRSTSYRQLNQVTKDHLDETTAIDVIIKNLSIIKRPIIETETNACIGFNPDQYQRMFNLGHKA